MPHNGYRPFDPSEVLRLFPDFAFTGLEAGLRAAFEEVRDAWDFPPREGAGSLTEF